ncbi:DUF3784 domain-containing protein [Clostridium sp.]|uniref:DUF3784 domain-containing protein n=1 Tax=Clostridium sp. TaxID=1506 RepID=UPI002FCAEBAD
MKGELLEMQIAFIFIGIFLTFIGFVSKTQNAGDMINGFNSKKHDKEKVSKIFGNNFLVTGLCILALISITFVFKNINIGILKTIIMAIFVVGVVRTMYQIEKYGKITPKK